MRLGCFSVQWIGTSMFRPHHKRKNWFFSVRVLKPVAETKWNAGEIRIERMRSSGPGGQHANKTGAANLIDQRAQPCATSK